MRFILLISLFVIYFSTGQAYRYDGESQLVDLNARIECEAPQGSPLDAIILEKQKACQSETVCQNRSFQVVYEKGREPSLVAARCDYERQNYLCRWSKSQSLEILLSRPQLSARSGRIVQVLRARLRFGKNSPSYPIFCSKQQLQQAAVAPSQRSRR